MALITILAHIGCQVPASFASVRTVDRLLSRLGSADCIEGNASSFMVEMQAGLLVPYGCCLAIK